MTYEEYKKTKREKSAAPDTVDTSDTVYASAPKMSYTEYRKKKGLPTELTGSDSQSYHQKLGQQPSNDDSAFGAEKVSVGNIKTMQRLLGTQDSGIWSEDTKKQPGALPHTTLGKTISKVSSRADPGAVCLWMNGRNRPHCQITIP